MAVDIVRGLTGSDDGLQSLANYSKMLLPSLSRLLSGDKVLVQLYSLVSHSYSVCSLFTLKYQAFLIGIVVKFS